MAERPVSLTLIDRQVLDSYAQFIDGLGSG